MAETGTRAPQGADTPDRRTYALYTLAVVAAGWIIAAVNTGISYLALGLVAIPIVTGLIGCLAVVTLLRLLHCAWWLAVLSAAPALFVLVGSVQYAPEAALDSRGVRETVRITADSAEDHGGGNHRFTLVGEAGELDETLDWNGSFPDWRVGDRIEIVRDPEGVVPLEAATDVDPGGRLTGLLLGGTGWTALTLLAGLRGFTRRRAGRRPVFDD
ncbi:hypothetical protein I3F58_01870 [Streptomyces sp. MUM 203J]|uniref:hypothetical protein n=1 Tax=Streptomyces sp. MUM 203J TaxID=2791990 RepID=UPI001F046514|nr:hypothetical protein [Streptomyces sp. MUM 203J]MCH0538328.1 hypothetical protein [Streptomyces sp. MUM 203J]